MPTQTNATKRTARNTNATQRPSVPQPRCTWKHCTARPRFAQRRDDGSLWANLCSSHNTALERVIARHVLDGNPQAVLATWQLATGGAAAFAQRYWQQSQEDALQLRLFVSRSGGA